ncbi:peptidase family M13 [Teladorsagia circumcincta]|uniref:Peptidase family M13 n=1 Tax=Teladorsagia circumcincta TaxID=45464 RepID=A0A2G9UQU8_TELCI|nr:peptidase family M13 [Teladorsagia circumcincta]
MAAICHDTVIAVVVDPCVDFFEFACGKWLTAHPIPKEETAYDQMKMLSDKVVEQLRDAFESPEIFPSKSMNALKSMYHKCMDKKELNRIGSTHLLRTIRSYGVWPMVDGDSKWRVKDFDLTSLMIRVSDRLKVFIAYTITLDYKNVSRFLVQFDQADLGLGRNTRDYYLDRAKHGKKIEAYRQLLIGRVKLINNYAHLPNDDEKITSDVNEIIELETKIAKIMVAEEDRRDLLKRYHLQRLSYMQNLTPMIDWSRYLLSIVPHSVHNYIAADPQVLIMDFDYMGRQVLLTSQCWMSDYWVV